MNKPREQKQPSGIIHAQQTTIYKGQLPPPEMLEKFEAIQPGFTDRLLKMVEDESAFKREQDRFMLKSFQISFVLGIVFTFLSVIIISAVAVFAIYKGFAVPAASIMATSIVGVIIAFIQKQKQTKEEGKNSLVQVICTIKFTVRLRACYLYFALQMVNLRLNFSLF